MSSNSQNGESLPLANGATLCEKCGRNHGYKCTAHRKRRDKNGNLVPCGGHRVEGKTVCRMHGGTSLSGPSHPNWEHGRRSLLFARLPKQMAEVFNKVRNDKELLDLSDGIALLTTRELDLAEKLQNPPSWQAAVAAFRQFAKNKKDNAKNLAALEEVLEKGALKAQEWERTWGKLQDVLRDLRDLTMAEHRRRLELRGMLNIEDQLVFENMLFTKILEVIQDESVARKDVGQRVYELMVRQRPKEITAEVE